MKQFSFYSMLILALSVIPLTAYSTAPSLQPETYQRFIDKMVTQHQFDRDELNTLLSKSVVKQSILKAMSSPAEKRLEWHAYRKIFLKPNRINGGIKFWKENKALLEAASEKYGVPEEIIVAIIGVETRYGGNTGSYKVLDALTTLGFHFPKRSKFFLSELEHFLLLCREEGFDPYEPKGSYAGAMGQSQFISSRVKKVIGIESIYDAVESAKKSAIENCIDNAEFVVGDMKNIFNEKFIQKYGKADLIITDPPRDGMHKKVINELLKLETHKIIYISCNPSTQHRDIEMLNCKYKILSVQPVDMFPHTNHVENIVLLKLRDQ